MSLGGRVPARYAGCRQLTLGPKLARPTWGLEGALCLGPRDLFSSVGEWLDHVGAASSLRVRPPQREPGPQHL